jgi:predicted DNA-binding protein
MLIRLTPELEEALRARADLEGRRLAPVIRTALRRYLREPVDKAS